MVIWNAEIFVMCLLYGKERKKKKKRKYSRCTILLRINDVLSILFISSRITQTETKLF